MTTTKAKNARRMKKREKMGNGSSLGSFQTLLKENKHLTPDFVPGVTVLTREEVSKHNSPSDCWTIYKGNVYNISPFLDYHPGGEEELMKAAGVDCTAMYDKIHPWVNADAVLGQLKLGSLRSENPTTPKNLSTRPSPQKTNSRIPSPNVYAPSTSQTGPDAIPDEFQSPMRSPPKPSLVPPSPTRSKTSGTPKPLFQPESPGKRAGPILSMLAEHGSARSISAEHGSARSIGGSNLRIDVPISIPASPRLHIRAKHLLNRPIGIFNAFASIRRR